MVAAMPYTGVTVNAPGADRWAFVVGALVLNFGALEFLTLVWISRLSPQTARLPVKLEFTKRIHRVIRLIRSATLPSGAPRKDEIINAWKAVEKLAEVRNLIAHNPVVEGWHGDHSDGRPADFICVPHARGLDVTPTSMRTISLDALLEVDRDVLKVLTWLNGITDACLPPKAGRPL
jgi:hypothetical protein